MFTIFFAQDKLFRKTGLVLFYFRISFSVERTKMASINSRCLGNCNFIVFICIHNFTIVLNICKESVFKRSKALVIVLDWVSWSVFVFVSKWKISAISSKSSCISWWLFCSPNFSSKREFFVFACFSPNFLKHLVLGLSESNKSCFFPSRTMYLSLST